MVKEFKKLRKLSKKLTKEIKRFEKFDIYGISLEYGQVIIRSNRMIPGIKYKYAFETDTHVFYRGEDVCDGIKYRYVYPQAK